MELKIVHNSKEKFIECRIWQLTDAVKVIYGIKRICTNYYIEKVQDNGN